jgi:hypothetical protein
LHGVAQTLDPAPKARYGSFLTVDREEIEHINEIRRLIVSYRASEADRRPLSLAVFGPPGSGKSFAIKQVAEELFGRTQATLEFNLSQLGSRGELHEAFDQVRDATIRGKIPLVFWDEFDSGNLVWLKEFLAPMQDAEFRVGSVARPFGKVIFVFAGGTCATFREFDRSATRGPTGEQFRQAKGPDFVSRLRGFVDIKGPNPALPAEASGEVVRRPDVAHLIRRAMLLRSVLERSYPHLVDRASGTAAISASVIRGFLRAERFHHGARSVEAIVAMSGLTGARHFGVAELPSPDLLSLHVTPDFTQWVEQGELEEASIELLAEATHRAWSKMRRVDGWSHGVERSDERKTHPLLVDYYQLAEADRERNRHTARVTLAKLHQIGTRIVPVQRIPEGYAALRRFTPAERRRLIEIEHAVWLRDHLLRGYEYAEITDERLRLHRDITTFDRLPDADRRLMEATVDDIPDALWKGGYVLVKATRLPDRIQIGVTGHRALGDTATVAGGVREAIERIRRAYGDLPVTALSMLAEGADRLVAEELLRASNARLVAVLPSAADDYAVDFGPNDGPSRLHFDALLAQAAEVMRVPDQPSRDEGYLRAGHAMVDRCDVLLAVWDGATARGKGGTAEVVAYARARGKPLVIVHAGNQNGEPREPAEAVIEPGSVSVEGL